MNLLLQDGEDVLEETELLVACARLEIVAVVHERFFRLFASLVNDGYAALLARCWIRQDDVSGLVRRCFSCRFFVRMPCFPFGFALMSPRRIEPSYWLGVVPFRRRSENRCVHLGGIALVRARPMCVRPVRRNAVFRPQFADAANGSSAQIPPGCGASSCFS